MAHPPIIPDWLLMTEYCGLCAFVALVGKSGIRWIGVLSLLLLAYGQAEHAVLGGPTAWWRQPVALHVAIETVSDAMLAACVMAVALRRRSWLVTAAASFAVLSPIVDLAELAMGYSQWTFAWSSDVIGQASLFLLATAAARERFASGYRLGGSAVAGARR